MKYENLIDSRRSHFPSCFDEGACQRREGMGVNANAETHGEY